MTLTATLTQTSTPGGVFDEGVVGSVTERAREIAVQEAPEYTGGDPRKQAVAGQVKRAIRARVTWNDLDHAVIEVYADLPEPLIEWILKGTKGGTIIRPKYARTVMMTSGSPLRPGPVRPHTLVDPQGRNRLMFYGRDGQKHFAREIVRGNVKPNDFAYPAAERVRNMIRDNPAMIHPERLVRDIFARLADV